MANKLLTAQLQTFYLYPPGVSIGQSTLTLNSFKSIEGVELTMADFGGVIGYGTVQPNSSDREEQISFSGITQNVNGTATLTGIKNVGFLSPHTETANFAKSHPGGVKFIISNTSGYENTNANQFNEVNFRELVTFPSVAGDDRPILNADTDAILSTELITLGQVNRLITSSTLAPSIVSTSTGTTGTSTATSLTWQHTHLGTNGLLVVQVSTQQDQTISGVTFNGDALTQSITETRVTGNLRVETWYLINPDLGTYDIIVTMSGAAYITGAGISFNGVNQSTPIDAVSAGANGSSTAPSTSLTTITENDIVIDVLGTANDPLVATATAPQAIQAEKLSAATRQVVVSVQGTTLPGSYTNAYTISPSTNWAIQSVAVKGLTNAGVDGYTVKATNADTTPNYLDDKIEIVSTDNTVVVTKTIQNPAGDEKISYDLSATVNINVDSVTLIEDFLNGSNLTEAGTGTDTLSTRYLYASWDNGTSNPASNTPRNYSLDNHPGIVQFNENSGGFMQVFNSARVANGATISGGIPLDNDFTLEILSKVNYNVDASTHTTEYSISNDGSITNFKVRADTGNNDIEYTLFSTTGTTTIPASDTWFTAKWVYSSGTLSFYIDGVLIDSEVGTFGSNTGGVLEVACNEVGGGVVTTYIDYVLLNYVVTR